METEKDFTKGSSGFGVLFFDLLGGVRGLLRNEIALAKAELKETTRNLGKHSFQAAFFGSLLALSIFPFFAFLIIALGYQMNGRYGLSSLIIAVLCAAIGGFFSLR